MASRKSTIVAISSAKGGVGKTITTINLAGVFKVLGKKVLIVDLDLYSGGIAVYLNKNAEKNFYNLVDDINNNRYKEFMDYIIHYDDQIDFLACPKDPRQANKVDSKYIDLVLDKASFQYDVILIDTNHILNEINVVTLDKVDKILFMVTNDPIDLKNMRSLLSIFRDIGLNNYKVILNNSRDPFKKYFSLFDIKNIIKNNIDYTISPSFFIKDIDRYIMNGQIITLLPKAATTFSKDFAVLTTIANDILVKEEDTNESA